MVEIATIDEATRAKIAGLADALREIPAELGFPQLLALLTIASDPGLSVNDLAERLGVPQQTASRHAATLSGRYQGMFDISDENTTSTKSPPLITQEISQIDPRRRALFISKQGRVLLQTIAKRLGTF
jgi:DNA-binding MarR family transcriptional regulator